MFVANLFKSRCGLEAENLFLRHQLNIVLWAGATSSLGALFFLVGLQLMK